MPPASTSVQTKSSLPTTIRAWATTTTSQRTARTQPSAPPPTEASRAAPNDPPRYHERPRTQTKGPGRYDGCSRPPARWAATLLPGTHPTYDPLPRHLETCGSDNREPNARHGTCHPPPIWLQDDPILQTAAHMPIHVRRRIPCHARRRYRRYTTTQGSPTGTQSATRPHRAGCLPYGDTASTRDLL